METATPTLFPKAAKIIAGSRHGHVALLITPQPVLALCATSKTSGHREKELGIGHAATKHEVYTICMCCNCHCTSCVGFPRVCASLYHHYKFLMWSIMLPSIIKIWWILVSTIIELLLNAANSCTYEYQACSLLIVHYNIFCVKNVTDS